MKKWARAMYQPNLPLREGERVTASSEHVLLSKEAAGEGMVLLKNDRGLLPLRAGTRLAMFGKGSFDYVKGGGGSGDVGVAYVHNLYDGLKMQGEHVDLYEPLADFYRKDVQKQYADGSAPGMTVEPELTMELVQRARAFADTALVTISRFSGEGWDRSSIECNNEYNPWETETSMPKISGEIFPDGDFYLTRAEKEMLQTVKDNFTNIVVVLNVGGIMDTTWFKDEAALPAVLLAWQGGMEGGLAAAELLCGKTSPSGKLVDTFAESLADYPSTANFHESMDYIDYKEDIYVGYRYFETIPGADRKVCYPFGFGLSYTAFQIEAVKAWQEQEAVHVQARVTNVGDREGKEVVQLYYSSPQGMLQKPARELVAFAKTRNLKAGESQTVTLTFQMADMASYDDLGKIAAHAYVLEQGEYTFYLGNSVRAAEKLSFSIVIEENTITRQLSKKCAPTSLKQRMLADGTYEELVMSQANDPNECVLVKMEPGTEEALVPAVCGRESYMMLDAFAGGRKPLLEVAEGRASMDEFLEQLSDDDLIHLLGGQPNLGVANTFGFGNLPQYGVPSVMTADGPAGVRISGDTGITTTAWPCATLLASTWNVELLERIGKAGAQEMKENNLAVWLTPAVNIHRNPLCGRNFEYYSEDPYLTGKLGAGMVRGIQSEHIAAAVKHFACNNKETNRKHCDSRVSERALREIYLKAFEIIVKEADPWVIMSAYNVINGHRASENRELLEDILRGEWNFSGMVTSDWWTRGEQYKEIKAGNDVKMACGFPARVKLAMEKGALTREDLLRCARRVLELIIKID